MSHRKLDGTADVTPEELELAKQRTHEKDVPKEINHFLDIFKRGMGIKKYVKGKPKERVNWYRYTKVSDGWMIKYEVEGFLHGTSLGIATLKFYVSDEKFDEVKKFVDKFPKRQKLNSRNMKMEDSPKFIETKERPENMLINLDDLWDLDEYEKREENKQKEEEEFDPFTQ